MVCTTCKQSLFTSIPATFLELFQSQCKVSLMPLVSASAIVGIPSNLLVTLKNYCNSFSKKNNYVNIFCVHLKLVFFLLHFMLISMNGYFDSKKINLTFNEPGYNLQLEVKCHFPIMEKLD
jgi:hypothetical protein